MRESRCGNWALVWPENIHTACPGMPGFVGRRGAGAYPIEEKEQFIPVYLTASTSLPWDNGFDEDRVFGDEHPPEEWQENYQHEFGGWMGFWEKGFYENWLSRNPDAPIDEDNYKTHTRNPRRGSGSANWTDNPRHIGTEGHKFIARIWATDIGLSSIKEKDVWFAQGNFYVAIADSLSAELDDTEVFTEVTPQDVHTVCPGMPGYIGAGRSSYPIQPVARIYRVDSEGRRATQATSDRVLFYTNPHENPEMFEAGFRVRRREDVMILRTFFAVNPAYVANSRIPSNFTELDQEITLSGGPAKLFTAADTNLSIEFKTIRVAEYLWAVEMTLTRFGEWEADAQHDSSDPEDGMFYDEGWKHGVWNPETKEWEETNPQPDPLPQRNFPVVDGQGYWGYYHKIPTRDRRIDSDTDRGQKPSTSFKEAN